MPTESNLNSTQSLFPENIGDKDLLNLLKLSTDLAADEVFWMGDDSEIIYVNNAACNKLGYTPTELLGKHVWEWDPLFSKEIWPDFWAQLKADKYIAFETQHQHRNGKTFPVRIQGHFVEYGAKGILFAYVTDITDFKKQELDLHEKTQQLEILVKNKTEQVELEKRKFAEFVSHAPVGIAINKIEDGKFTFTNAEFCHLTGYKIEELNTMDYWALTPKKYKAQEQQQLASMIETGKYGPYLKEYIHKHGHTVPVLLSGIKITESDGQDYIWSVVQDMSQQRAIEEKLLLAKEKADAAAVRIKLANDSAGIGVWEWDIDSDELIWDEWMYKLYGVSYEQFSGAYEAWENCVHPDDIEKTKATLENAIKGNGIFEPEFRVVHPDGEIRTLKASAEVFKNEKGEAIKVIGVNYDITLKVDALNSLAQAKLEAEKASQSKSEFLANMSHEIRTPMNSILGGLQLLQQSNQDEKLKIILDNSTYSARTLLTILNDILDFSKIEDQKLELENEPFSFLEVLESVKYDIGTLANNKGIELQSIIDDSFDDGWIGDLVRVKQILLNLVSNAVKFTNKGSVTIKISGVNYGGNKAICINVIDTGIGMTEESQSRIFERFSQADTSTTRKFGGTGLGVSISASLVQIMGGTIDLKSTLGKGTDVRVILPLKQTTLLPKEENNKSLEIPNMSGKSILIAEDNEINQVIVQSMLSPTEADLTIVSNGKLALEAASKMDFDLILMDIQMPEMDGNEAQQKIKAIKSHIPIIALTSNVMIEDVKRYLAEGFVAHLPKPIELNVLYKVLSQYQS